MTLKVISDWPRTRYDSKIHNIATEFFIPALRESTTYRRIGGFFSSTSMALAARGIKNLIENDGKMQLVISPILTKEDAAILNKSSSRQDDTIIHQALMRTLDLSVEFEKNHVAALAYLLKRGFLEIKIDVPTDTDGNCLDFDTVTQKNMLDEKLGIFQDRDGNAVSFRGPVNENRQSWERGIFSITVDVDWIEGQKTHVEDDVIRFQQKWASPDVMALPHNTREMLLMEAPDTAAKIDLDKFNVPPWAILSNGKILWNHQIRTVNSWINSNCRGILNMATSGGKTLCALVSASLTPADSIVVILVPTKVLVDQWKKEILEFDPNTDLVICNSDHSDWNSIMAGKLGPYVEGKPRRNRHLLILSTMSTAASNRFIRNFDHISPNHITMISDEVHHLGAPKYRRVLGINALRRMGLSATFERDWDEIGTAQILKYFGRPIDTEYTVADGIRDKKLSRYEYHPFFAYLTNSEFNEYREYSERISSIYAQIANAKDHNATRTDLERKYQQLLINRAEIIKKANDKFRAYAQIVNSSPEKPYIVFADDNNHVSRLKTVHKDTIRQINIWRTDDLERDDIMVFDGDLSPSEREKILEESKKNQTPLFAMYCLDEGVDIPEFRSAILVSSSASKRQYIQRRGRILRTSKHKIAHLYDIIVLPNPSSYNVDADTAESIISKEKERIRELAGDSINKWEVDGIMDRKLKDLGFA